MEQFELGYRRLWGRWEIAIEVAFIAGLSIWLFTAMPQDLFSLSIAAAFVALMFASSGWELYRRSRPQRVDLDEKGFVIRLYPGIVRYKWSDIESAELIRYPLGPRVSRAMFNLAFTPGGRGHLVQMHFNRRPGIWNALRGGYVRTGFPFGKTVSLPVIDAERFVEIAQEYLSQISHRSSPTRSC